MCKRCDQKQIRKAIFNDMEQRVSPDARKSFYRPAYSSEDITDIKNIQEIKHYLSYLRERVGELDDWERETIKRMAGRMKERGDTSGQEYTV